MVPERSQLMLTAIENRRLYGGDDDAVRRIVDSSALVFAVWTEPGEPESIGLVMIKGRPQGRSGARAGAAWPDSQEHLLPEAVLCRDFQHALEVRRMFGPAGRSAGDPHPDHAG